MALIDRMRDRMRGQRPIGAADEMQRGMRPPAEVPYGGPEMPSYPGMAPQDDAQRGGRYGLQHNRLSEDEIGHMGNGRTPEELDAYMLGRQMGLESFNEMAGQSIPGDVTGMGKGQIMTPERLNSAMNTLMRYRSGKASVNKRVRQAQQWWKLKNWEQIQQKWGTKGAQAQKSNTGWLWNCIVGKHADAIDCYPEPIFLPRSQEDKEEAERLSKIIPVELQINDFEQTYNDCSWQKMQEGTGVYGVFWDPTKLNGLGDLAISKVNILNLYWEPGVNDIEDSRNLFYISYVDMEELNEAYPELAGKMTNAKLFIEKYETEDNVDMSNKAVLIDWYYKKRVGGRTVLHYCKFVGITCLYSSEEEGMTEGYYEDGEYPFVLDPLYPVEGSPAGYGYIDIASDTQTDIDTLSQAMVLNATMRATPRYFGRTDGGINEQEFMDVSKPIVHVRGQLGQEQVRPIEVPQMGNDAHNMLASKIDEIKFITGNTDVNNGGVPSGVTAASAIAALKEDSGRSSKDSTKAAYRAYRKINYKVLSRVRQFMDIPRQFRILGQDGQEEFIQYSNQGLQTQQIYNLPGQEPALRMPIFDIEVRAQRENAYTTLSQNELILDLWNRGLLNPQVTDQALIVLNAMDFRGKNELIKEIKKQGTMMDVLGRVGQIALALAQKYDPQMVPQLGAVLQGIEMDTGAQAIPAGDGTDQKKLAPDNAADPAHEANENGIVRNARERAANASRPD